MDVQTAASMGGPPVPATSEAAAWENNTRVIRGLLLGLFLIASTGALYFARDFFMPVILAFLLALTLTPIVRLLKRHGVAEGLSASLLVLSSVIVLGIVGYLLSGPIAGMVDNAPAIRQQLTDRLAEIRHPFERVLEVSEQVDKAADASTEPDVQKVVLAQPGMLSRAAGSLRSAVTNTAITFVLSLFLLASGTLFYEKIVQSFTRLSDKKRALRVVHDVETEISRYLLTVALINASLGVVTGLGLWALGVPNPLVWGAVAALLNFLPYIGPLITILLVGTISLISFASISYALVPPAFVFLLDVIEGQFLTPILVGRRLEINAVAIFIAVAFWSWLWGIVGALIAVPLLVVIKVFCDHFDGLRHVGNFLAAQQSMEQIEADAATAKAAT